MKALIASPVHERPAILRAFLDGLARLDIGGLEADFAFVDDNADAASSDLLEGWDRPGRRRILTFTPGDVATGERKDEITHRWTGPLMDRVGAHRDRILQAAREGGYDHLLLVDSDLVLRPATLKTLIAQGKDILSLVFWTRWNPEEEPRPNVWLGGMYRLFRWAPGEGITEREARRRMAVWLAELRRPGLHRVWGLGACTLISRKALEAGVAYRRNPALDYQGEDRHFCVRADDLGLEMWALSDPELEPLHLYRDADLERVAGWWQKEPPTP